MPRPRRLSGADVVRILEGFGFMVVSERGSHVKLRRETGTRRETLTVPNHRELDAGTVRAIARQASQYVSEELLHDQFFID